MKVYVAGKYADRQRCSEIMDLLRSEGDEITCDWTHHKYEDELYPIQYCLDDFHGVKVCDVYVGVFMDDYNYKGSLVEFGIALGFGKRIIILGHKMDSCIFYHFPGIIKVETVGELLYEMSTLAQEFGQ